MSREEKLHWLTILKEAEEKEGFVSLFDEDEEVDVQELLEDIIRDYED